MYVELNCHEEAVQWFEKGWEVYAKNSNQISRYVYSLVNLNNQTRAQALLNEIINEISEEIKNMYELECDENWTESDMQERIKNCSMKRKSMNKYMIVFQKVIFRK